MNRLKLCFALCLVSFLLSGCWDRLEIEDRAVVLGIAIDEAREEDADAENEISHQSDSFLPPKSERIQITAQIAVPGRIPLGPETGGGHEQVPVWVIRVTGHTVDDAMLNLQQQVSDQVFFGHLRVIIISKEIAEKGVEKISSYFRRNPEFRRLTWLLVSEGRAERVMEVAPPLERVPALYLLATLDHAVQMGKFPNDFLGIFWIASSSKGRDPYLPYIRIRDAENIEIAGMAYFSGDKLVGVTDALEIGIFMAIKGINPGGYSAFVQVPGTNRSIMFRATHRDSKTQMTIKNGRPHFKVRVNIEGNLDEKSAETFSLTEPGIIKEIEKALAREGRKSYTDLFAETQRKGSDIFGFGEYVRAKAPAFWNRHVKTAEGWRAMYKEITVDFEPKYSIRRVGMKSM